MNLNNIEKELLRPDWVIRLTVIPQAVLLLLYVLAYKGLHTAFEAKTDELWLILGETLLLSIVVQTGFALWAKIQKKSLNEWFFLCAIAFQMAWLGVYLTQIDMIYPNDIPAWMYAAWDMREWVTPLSFPSLIYGLVAFSSFYFNFSGFSWKSSLAEILGLPILFYLIIVTLNYFDFASLFGFSSWFLAAGFLLVFFRAFYKVIHLLFWGIKKANITEAGQNYRFLIGFFLGLMFPLGGLYLNVLMDNFFGNFESSSFFIVAVFNGISILLPQINHVLYRIVVLFLRAIGLSYVLYFALIFAQFIPFAVPFVVLGFGILMLTPLMLLIWQSAIVMEDLRFLARNYNAFMSSVLFGVGFLLLPSLIAKTFYQERQTFHAALEYVYESDYAENKEEIDVKQVQRLIEHIRNYKNRRAFAWNFAGNHATPIIDHFYSWIVFDHLSLSWQKTEELANVFLGQKLRENTENSRIKDSLVVLKNVNVQSKFDSTENIWLSDVELSIVNKDTNGTMREFTTSFDLPEEAFVTDYFLFVGDKKEKGILAERKTALWIYNQIVSTRLDPGILFYEKNGNLRLNVFPFAASETRKTGFQIAHKAPFSLQLDSVTFTLGKFNPKNKEVFLSSDKSTAYIPAAIKKNLPLFERDEEVQFLLDGAHTEEKTKEIYIKNIKKYLQDEGLKAENCKFWLIDYRAKALNPQTWDTEFLKHYPKGGFFVERAVKTILQKNIEKQEAKLAKFIFVTQDSQALNHVADWKMWAKMCKTSHFTALLLNENGMSQIQNQVFRADAQADKKCLVWENAGKKYFLRNDTLPELVYLQNSSIAPTNNNLSLFEKGILLKNLENAALLKPNLGYEHWLKTVQLGFKERILSPSTAFIVVETEAQKATLLKKQEEVLKSKKSLDLSEDQRMSEPESYGWWLLLGLMAGVFFWKKTR